MTGSMGSMTKYEPTDPFEVKAVAETIKIILDSQVLAALNEQCAMLPRRPELKSTLFRCSGFLCVQSNCSRAD